MCAKSSTEHFKIHIFVSVARIKFMPQTQIKFIPSVQVRIHRNEEREWARLLLILTMLA